LSISNNGRGCVGWGGGVLSKREIPFLKKVVVVVVVVTTGFKAH
jgi:hypothetical protein